MGQRKTSDLAAMLTERVSFLRSTGVTSAGWDDRVHRSVVESGFRLECETLPETPPSGRIGYSFVVNSSIRLSPGRARVLEVFLMLQTRYCPLQMGSASLTPGWLALALVLSSCGTPEAPGAPGTRPRPARGDVKAAGKLPGLDATSQSKSQAKVVSTIEGDRMTVVSTGTLSKQLESSPFRFTEVYREAGIEFVHFSGMTAEKYFPT